MGVKNLLLTGPPRSGKSTLIERITAQVQMPLCGFFTREIRQSGQRVGFAIITMDGQEGVLAHQDFRARFRVGKYGVNLADLERLALPAMQPAEPGRLVVVDEIGKMECLSPGFQQALVRLLDSDHQVLGSISQKGGPFIQAVKQRPDVELIRITPASRDQLVSLAHRFGVATRPTD